MTKRYHADLPSWIFIGGISCLPCLLFAAQVYDLVITHIFLGLIKDF